MSLRTFVGGLLVAGFLQLAVLQSNTQAQHLVRRIVQNAPARSMGTINTAHRFFGHWHSAGYHTGNAGHDTSYYNPWNAHNSALVSEGHLPYDGAITYASQFGGQYGVQYDMQQYGVPVQGVPYQATPGLQNPGSPDVSQSAPSPFGGSYEPFDDVEEEYDTIDAAGQSQAGLRGSLQRYNESRKDDLKSVDVELPQDALNYSNTPRNEKK